MAKHRDIMATWANKSRWAGASAILLRTAAFVVPAFAPLASRATVPVLMIAAVWLAIESAAEHKRLPLPGIDVMAGIIVLFVWAAVSNIWALSPAARPLAMLAGTVFAGFFVVAWARRIEAREAIGDVLVLGIGVGLLVYAFEAISGAWLTRFVHDLSWREILDDIAGGISIYAFLINGTVLLSLLLWPAICIQVSRGRLPSALLLAALVTTATVMFGSAAGVLALALGALAWGLAAWIGRRAAQVAAVAFMLLVFATPFAAQRLPALPEIERLVAEAPQVPSSALIRLVTWKFAAVRISERPIVGWGFDAARSIPSGGDSYELRAPDGRIVAKEIYLPLHPHNQILQLWLELGVVGALIVAASGGFLIWRTGAFPPPARNAALALAATVLTYDCLSFGAWQTWWIAAVFLATAMQSVAGRSGARL